MIEWVALGAAAATSGVILRAVRRRLAFADYRKAFELAAARMDARISTGSMAEGPELRAEVKGATVTLKLRDVHKSDEDGVAEAIAQLPKSAENVRLYFGWDATHPTPGNEHVPEIPYPGSTRVEGSVVLRAKQEEIATGFVEATIVDLIHVRREARAHALEVMAKGGYVTLKLFGIRPSHHLLERAVIVAATLGRAIERLIAGESAKSEENDQPCTLCGDKSLRDVFVSCKRCHAPYHRDCFAQATGCVNQGCRETETV